jgi:hypothetical protein
MPFPIILQQEPQTGVARAARPLKVISNSIQQQMSNGPGIANLFARLMSPIRKWFVFPFASHRIPNLNNAILLPEVTKVILSGKILLELFVACIRFC